MGLNFPFNCWGTPGPLPVNSQQSTVSAGGGAVTLSITFSRAPVAGEVVVLTCVAGASSSITTPSGFTAVTNGGNTQFYMFYKKCTGGEGATFSVGTFNTNGYLAGTLITNCASTVIDSSNYNGATNAAPALTTSFINELVIYSCNAYTSVIIPPGVNVLISGTGTTYGGILAYNYQQSPATIPTVTWNFVSGGGQVGLFVLSIRSQ